MTLENTGRFDFGWSSEQGRHSMDSGLKLVDGYQG
jgi:hypothetical protein